MCLYDKLVNISPEKVHYYPLSPKINVIQNLTEASAYDYIIKYYKHGEKGSVFNVGFIDKFQSNGKHMHTVVLYYLGCLFSDLVDSKLKSYIEKFIQTDDWYDFRYTWFLTCLYHDTATVIEKEDWELGCRSDLDFYLSKYNIKYSVFEHNWEHHCLKPYTYPESLVKNYFKYRVEHGHSIDHGIIAGYLLYDRLVNNYNMALKEYSSIFPDANYEVFNHENLCWRNEHIAHFAIIADAIIAHNIWLSDNDSRYKQFGLDRLIAPKNKLTLTDNPLIFFLGLFDTIEPVKRFGKLDCLKHIDIDIIDNYNEITITAEIIDTDTAIKWIRNVDKMKDWLYVEIEVRSPSQIAIRIK